MYGQAGYISFIKQQIRKLYRFFFVLSALVLLIAPQTGMASELDSLKQLLKGGLVEYEHEIRIFEKITQIYMSSNLDSASYYVEKSIEMAKGRKDERLLAHAWHVRGDIELHRDNLDSAFKYFQNSVDLFKNKGFENDFASTYNRLGNITFSQGKYIEALKYFQSGLKIAERSKDSLKIAVFYSNLGVLHSNLHDDDKALDYFMKSLKINKANSNYCATVTLLSTLGLLYADQGDFEKAKEYLREGIEMIGLCGRATINIQFYVDLGRFEMNLNNYRQAIGYLKQALDNATNDKNTEIVPESTYLCYIYEELGNSCFHLAEFDKAKEYYYQGLGYANKGLNPDAYSNITSGLADIYEHDGQMDSALHYFKIYKETSDSLLNQKNVREIAQLEFKYEYEKELEQRSFLEEIQKKKTRIFQVTTFAISALLVVLFLIFVLFSKSKKNQLNQAALVQKNMQIDLDYKKKELITKAIYFHRKEDFMVRVTQKLKAVKSKAKIENAKELEKILKELEHDASNKEWKEFELRFNEVHDDFYGKLKAKFQGLTPNDLKLCALLKLGMSTKEIATITFQSLNSINVARYRLRKKLMLDTEVNLNHFLSGF